jgi:hypothetical protein
MSQQTDFLLFQGEALRDRAEALALAGDTESAIDDLGVAITLFERKGIVTLAGKARTLRARLSDVALAAGTASVLP